MSIVALEKVTLVGHAGAKDAALDHLQDLGYLHVLPATEGARDVPPPKVSAKSRRALEFLLRCPHRGLQTTDERHFDPQAVELEALELQRRLLELGETRDRLRHRIAEIEPWGSFELPPRGDLGNHRMWFYVVPTREMARFAATELTWAEVHRDGGSHYLVVLSENQPEGLPVPRTRTGMVSRDRLRERLEAVELEIEDLEATRAGLTRWCTLLARNLDRLEDRAARQLVAKQTADVDPVFALRAWAPRDRLDELRSVASDHGMALQSRPAEPADEPPTLLRNARPVAAGEQLVTFYTTPGYFSWDPSAVVFLSFTVFFAMIVSDAGYGLLMGLVAGRFWRRMGRSELGRRMRTLFASLAAATTVYGVLAGSYFGEAPRAGSWLAGLRVLDVADANTMMTLSVVLGVAHLVLANAMDAWRLGRSSRALAPLGWIGLILGGFLLVGGSVTGHATLRSAGLALLAAGGLLVFFFTGADHRPLVRAASGALAFTRVTKAFGDALSYLRLFALGLATASLAASFNDMASRIQDSMPGIGLFFALMVLLIGHLLNFVLAVASGVIHGLRLNVIEFLGWSIHDEGKVYRPFMRKETASWNPSF